MKVLVAYDGSEYAHGALHDLLRAGLPPDTEVLVVSVADQKDEAVESAARAERLLSLQCPQWSIHSEGLAGPPARTLIEKSDDWRPDLLVAGSHGRSVFGRLLLGSVSHKLVSEARCSVRIARKLERPRMEPPMLVVGLDGSSGAAAAVREVASRCWPRGTEVALGTC
ncbi:MAG: universal stress protein [Acidobacteria bacterium]|nr:universal stress protein [Acidobacteriota bacterium]